MDLLIAEDDGALAGFLRRGLESEGYRVEVVGNGEEALLALTGRAPELAVLDLKMPQMDGIEVLRRAREAGARMPILVLTGRNELATRVECLDQGADDCMFKPFSLQELRARCRVLLRRVSRAQEPTLELEDLQIDRVGRRVERNGRRIELTNREYALLEQLVLEKGRCVTREALLDKVWGLASSETNVIDVYINYLRRKLEEEGEPRLIETVRGRGYRIAVGGGAGERKGVAGAAPQMQPV